MLMDQVKDSNKHAEMEDTFSHLTFSEENAHKLLLEYKLIRDETQKVVGKLV